MKNIKKPKGFRPGSRTGGRNQRISDAIKRAQANGYAWLTVDGERLKIIPSYIEEAHSFIVVERGNLVVREVYRKDGLWYMCKRDARHIQPKHILASVVESYKK